MKLESVLIDVEYSPEEFDPNEALGVLSKAAECIESLGYKSLEKEVAGALGSVLQCDLNPFDSVARPRPHSRLSSGVYLYSSCFVDDKRMIFVDLERFDDNKWGLELDVFASSRREASNQADRVVEGVRKSFGLTAPKSDLLVKGSVAKSMTERIRSRLTLSEEIKGILYDVVKEGADREILIGLKKRGTILERDLQDIVPDGKQKDDVKATLDYLSGEDFQLITRKYAIVCKDSREILFFLDDAKQLEGQHGFRCPKCSRPLPDEDLIPYYGGTDELRELIDGNRWMPISVKEALVEAGVTPQQIFTEVMHGDDEIDVLAVYGSTVLVIEVKGRSVNLNDAYKLSSKTSRLENLLRRTEVGRGLEDDLTIGFDEIDGIAFPYGSNRRTMAVSSRLARGGMVFVPVMISSHDIAQDAETLLKDNSPNAVLIDHSDGKIEDSVRAIVDNIDMAKFTRRFQNLISPDVSDSVSNHCSMLAQSALQAWLAASEDRAGRP